jgi:hypothetical protein
MYYVFKEFFVKKFVLFNLVFIIAVSIICASGNSDRTRGNGEEVTIDRSMPAFEEIQIITSASSNNSGSDGKSIVRIHSSEEYRLSLTIDSNLVQYVKIDAINNVLKIETTKRLRNDFFVDIYSPKISGISIGYIGKVEIIDKITVSSFSIKITGVGEIDGTIECDYFSADVNGAGLLTLTGNSKDAEINISGACVFDGEEFKINNVVSKLNGAGTVTIWSVDNLTADISGVGSIKYRGNPNVNFSRGGLGSIKRIE